MTITEYTCVDDFFVKKIDEIPTYFSKFISNGFEKKLMRGSTAKDLFGTAIKGYFSNLNNDLINELKEYEHKNKFENSLGCYEKNIHIVHQEILNYLDHYLNNFIRTKKEKDFIYNLLNTEVNVSIKNWYYTINKKKKPLLKKLQEFIPFLPYIIKVIKFLKKNIII